MKKILILIIGVVITTMIASCDDDDNEYTPNSSIIEVFYDYYPDATNVNWFYVNNYSVADFDYYGEEKEAWFSYSGLWLYTKTEIEYNDLPDIVQENFMNSYYNYEINDVEKIETAKYGVFYNIEIENDITEQSLLYTDSGILVRIFANTLPYTWWYDFDD